MTSAILLFYAAELQLERDHQRNQHSDCIGSTMKDAANQES